MRPLQGRQIVLTRPPADCRALCAGLRARGARVLVRPCLEVRPRALSPSARRRLAADLARCRLVALASRSAARALHAWLAVAGVRLRRAHWLACVGPATARLAHALWPAQRVVTASVADAQGLAALCARLLAPHAMGRTRVFLPAARDGRPELLASLRAHRLAVARYIAYETVVPARPLRVPEAVDCVVFASPSAVAGWLQRAPFPPGARCVTLGPTTRRAAEACGVVVAATATQPTLVALTDALVGLFAGSGVAAR